MTEHTPGIPLGSWLADLPDERLIRLLERRPGYYAVKIGSTAALLAVAAAAFTVLGDSWWQLATAACLAVVFAQLGFIGHDAGQCTVCSRHADPPRRDKITRSHRHAKSEPASLAQPNGLS